MKNGTQTALMSHGTVKTKPDQPFYAASAGPLLGADGAPNAPLNQKERALFRLALAIGARLEPEVRTFTRNARAAGWTPEEIRYGVRVATNAFSSPEVLTTAMWVEETLAKC